MTKKWKHNLPRVNGFDVIIEPETLTQALSLMWDNKIEPEDVDMYIVAPYN